MSDEQKQKRRDYQIDYRKKYYATKKLKVLMIIKLMIIKLMIMIMIVIFIASQ